MSGRGPIRRDSGGIDRYLANYRTLVERVDALCRRIETDFRGQIACSRGCDGCCRHLTLATVEAYALAAALSRLPAEDAVAIRERARRATADGPCPLLAGGECLLYAARPLICRTHGLPLLVADASGRRVDFCPENFRGVESLPGGAVIDLERLNAGLAAVDALFVKEALEKDGASPLRRLTLAEALLLEPG